MPKQKRKKQIEAQTKKKITTIKKIKKTKQKNNNN